MARLNNKEKKGKDFIDLAFDAHEGEWMDTSTRLLDMFKGKYFQRDEKKDRFVVNTMFSLVNLLLPHFIFQQPFIRVRPKQPVYITEDVLGKAREVNNVAAAHVREVAVNHAYTKIAAINEARKAVQDSLFFGFGICKTGYSYDTISQDDQDYILKDSVFHKRVCPKDFGWHPLATGLDDSIKLVHRITTTKSHLKNFEEFKGLEDIEGEVPKHIKEKVKNKKKLESYADYITLYEVLDQEEDMYYYYAGEQKKFVGKKERIYSFNGSDYSMVRLAGDNDEFVGIPLLGMVESEAIALNDVMTLMVEHMRKFPGQVFIEEGMVDEDQLEAMRTGVQGAVHVVKDLTNKLQFKPPLGMGAEYFNIVGLLQQIIDRVLGVVDFARLSGTNRKSATEASYLQGDSTIRRNYFVGIVKDFVLDGVKKIAVLQQQFQTGKEEVYVTEYNVPKLVSYSKEDLQGEWQYDFDVDSMAFVNQAELTNMNNVLTVLANHQILHPVLAKLDPQKLGKEIFKRANLNIQALQSNSVENMNSVDPNEENSKARQGELMPQPKEGENHEEHIKIHSQDLRDNGPNEQILDHLAETIILMNKERGAGASAAAGAGQQQGMTPQPPNQAQSLGAMAQQMAGQGPNEPTPTRGGGQIPG